MALGYPAGLVLGDAAVWDSFPHPPQSASSPGVMSSPSLKVPRAWGNALQEWRHGPRDWGCEGDFSFARSPPRPSFHLEESKVETKKGVMGRRSGEEGKEPAVQGNPRAGWGWTLRGGRGDEGVGLGGWGGRGVGCGGVVEWRGWGGGKVGSGGLVQIIPSSSSSSPRTMTKARLCFLHLTDEKTEAQGS